MNSLGQKGAQVEDNLNYYRRRAGEELAAAEQAPSAAVAAVHRSLADRYTALAGEPQPHSQQQVPATGS
jgi:hypothetical protein